MAASNSGSYFCKIVIRQKSELIGGEYCLDKKTCFEFGNKGIRIAIKHKCELVGGEYCLEKVTSTKLTLSGLTCKIFGGINM